MIRRQLPRAFFFSLIFILTNGNVFAAEEKPYEHYEAYLLVNFSNHFDWDKLLYPYPQEKIYMFLVAESFKIDSAKEVLRAKLVLADKLFNGMGYQPEVQLDPPQKVSITLRDFNTIFVIKFDKKGNQYTAVYGRTPADRNFKLIRPWKKLPQAVY